MPATAVCPKQQKVSSQLSHCVSDQERCQQFDLSHQTTDCRRENGAIISSELPASPGTMTRECDACQTLGLQLPQLIEKNYDFWCFGDGKWTPVVLLLRRRLFKSWRLVIFFLLYLVLLEPFKEAT